MEEKLLQLIKDKKYLYDKSDKNYKNIDLKLKTWFDIGNQIGKSGPEAEAHFKNLLERYIRERKNGKLGSARKQTNFVQLMSFIEERMHQKHCWMGTPRSDSNSDIDVIEDKIINFNCDCTSARLDDCKQSKLHGLDNYQQKFNNEKERENSKNYNSAKFKKYETIMRNFVDLYNKRATTFTLFCNHLDSELNTMPVNDAEALKDEISELVIKKRRQVRNRINQ